MHSLLIDRMTRKLEAMRIREQRDADEEGSGAVLCAIREARRKIIRGDR